MKHIKLFEDYNTSLGNMNLEFINPTYLINVNNGKQEFTIKVDKGIVLHDVSVDYVDDTEKIMDISNFTINEILELGDIITKIDLEDFRSYISSFNPENITKDGMIYGTNIKNWTATSVSYEDVKLYS